MAEKGMGKGWHYKYPEHALAAKGIRTKIKLPKGMKTSGVPTTDFTSVKFRNKVTGEIKTQIPIFELKDYEKLSDYESRAKEEKVESVPNELPIVKYKGKDYFVDFRLGELRNVVSAKPINFVDLKEDKNSEFKKELRGIRFRTYRSEYIAGVDD